MNRSLLLAASCCILFSSCLSMKSVEYKRVENFSAASEKNGPVLNFNIVFFNPNRYGCTISKIEATGAVNGQLLFNAGITKKVMAKGSRDFNIPLSANLAKMDLQMLIGAGFNLLMNDGKLPVKVNGKVKMKKFIFSKTYSFEYTEALDKAQLMKLF